MGYNDRELPAGEFRIPGWVRTPSLYVPTNKPVKEWTDEELRRGLCPKSGGRVEACRVCKSKCLFGFAMLIRLRQREQAAHGGGADKMMVCTKEAHDKCAFSVLCDEECKVPDDSDCAEFIRAATSTQAKAGEADPVEAAYLQQEREAIQEEGAK